MAGTPDDRQYRIWIDKSGEVWVEDPDRGVLPLASALAPDFTLGPAVAELPTPRLLKSRSISAPEPWPEDLAGLWALHDRLLTAAPVDRLEGPSLLDLKRAIAERLSRACVLCEHRCGVDRPAGERGRCKVGATSYFQDAYVHVGEEREIAPSLCVPLTGCSWHCVYCHTYDLINRVDHGRRLEPESHPRLIAQLADPEVRTLSFVGGNPDHHLVAILELLAALPASAIKPVVWNSNMYGSPELYSLLDGVVDVYLGDMRYGNDACARRLSGLDRCVEPVARNWRQVAEQDALLIVRLLLIPGHLDCCFAPMVAWLDTHLGQARISLMDQYHPTYQVARRAPEIDRTPSPEEVEAARALIRASGLSVVAEG